MSAANLLWRQRRLSLMALQRQPLMMRPPTNFGLLRHLLHLTQFSSYRDLVAASDHLARRTRREKIQRRSSQQLLEIMSANESLLDRNSCVQDARYLQACLELHSHFATANKQQRARAIERCAQKAREKKIEYMIWRRARVIHRFLHNVRNQRAVRHSN